MPGGRGNGGKRRMRPIFLTIFPPYIKIIVAGATIARRRDKHACIYEIRRGGMAVRQPVQDGKLRGAGHRQLSGLLYPQHLQNPGVSQEKLSKLIYVHKSNVARQLNSLEEKGFVTRVPDPRDKRSLLVYPTEKAQNALPFIREVHRRWNESVLAGFSEEERSAVASLMEKLSSNARRVAEELGGDER